MTTTITIRPGWTSPQLLRTLGTLADWRDRGEPAHIDALCHATYGRATESERLAQRRILARLRQRGVPVHFERRRVGRGWSGGWRLGARVRVWADGPSF